MQLRLMLCFWLLLVSSACQNERKVVDQPPTDDIISAAYPLRKQFQCLPREAALIAAHRGVSKGEGFAENSQSSLEALIDKGILVAEVDVAGLKDGTHILYHDGVWEEKSTGRGPVAVSNWSDAEKTLLNDTDGNLTADRPVKLSDVLLLAKDRLYLEIDFKSSAKYETVINMIRNAGMSDQVILIAYNDSQARRLAKLAPEMLLSVGIRDMDDVDALKSAGVNVKNMAVWFGRGPYDNDVVRSLDLANIPILAWPPRNDMKNSALPASLLVTDYAFEYQPISGLTKTGHYEYLDCLTK